MNNSWKTTKILFITANPTDTRPLAVDEEFRKIKEMLYKTRADDKFELVAVWAARPDDWMDTLNAQAFRVVHFSGHGTSGGALQHVGSNGQAQPVSLPALKKVFRDLQSNICLVVLNACYSRKQAEVIAEEADCVISMNNAIHDDAAIIFIGALYRALFSGKPVSNAFEQGKDALMLEGMRQDQIPELLVRAGIDAAKVKLIPATQRYRAYIAVSDDQRDRRLLDELHKHLGLYVRQKTVDYWDETKMSAGAKRRDEIKRALKSTKVAVLLISADLFNDRDFVEIELPLLLEDEKAGEVKILCVLVRPFSIDASELEPFNLVCPQPLSGMSQPKREEIWKSVARQVRDILQADS